MKIDWQTLTAAEVKARGVPAFGAGDLQRFYFGPDNRYLVDIRLETTRDGTREVVDRAFDIVENRTIWPPPKRAGEKRPAVRRIEWEGGGRRGAGTIRLDRGDLERLRDALDRSATGQVDLPLRWER